ncbi:hypothetical protein OG883_42630 [Streptomyces sp. NBC_01142]|uniref:hypothetical protein n=1 Tax=Streptomyces sp. NBC_01142 TaxID=2975865 RepID=UPI00225AD389|nr:hypothetical protein [Streptomyces sp. NBC_01142]MCX4826340.1 hypothetical protein [Streptomyces sp. NBC_01142]
MLTPPPDMYPGCTWADQPVTATTAFGIGSAATVEPRTGLTTRYIVHAFDPHTRTALIAPDQREDRAGVVRPVPDNQRTRRPIAIGDLDELRLIHRRTRDDITLLHTNHCRHTIKAAFTAGGDRGVPARRRVYRLWMQTSKEHTYRFLVRAPSQEAAYALARSWWQGTPSSTGFSGGRLEDGETIDLLTCQGARDMPIWPYPDPIADPV